MLDSVNSLNKRKKKLKGKNKKPTTLRTRSKRHKTTKLIEERRRQVTEGGAFTIAPCSVCKEAVPNRVIQRCGHVFCDKCVSRMDVCPKCREPFDEYDVGLLFLDFTQFSMAPTHNLLL